MMSKVLGLLATVALVCGAAPNTMAATLYFEDFTNQEGKGATGPGGANPTIDLAGITQYSIDVSAGNFDSNQDWFRVENGEFEARDVDGLVFWQTSVISVANFTNLQLTLDAFERGTQEADDRLRVEASVDGGAFSLLGQVNDDFTVSALSFGIVDGTSLQIRIGVDNDANNERLEFDNVLLIGDEVVSPVPEPLTLLGSAVAVAMGAVFKRQRYAR